MPLIAIWALLLTAAPARPAIVMAAPAASGVVVKLGTASLEEYRQGDPANRVQMTRG